MREKGIALFPGSKDWIQKYFHVINENEINFHQSVKCGCLSNDIHLFFIDHGILFGSYGSPIFLKDVNSSKWTSNEKIKFLLLESLLYVYLFKHKQFDKSEFIKELIVFYSLFKEESSFSFLSFDFLNDKSPSFTLEKILSNRVEIKSSFISTNKWINYIENSFVFLDVMLFDHYLNHSKNLYKKDLDILKFNTLLAVIQTSQADNVISKEEIKIFQTFLKASSLTSEDKQTLKLKFKECAFFDDYIPAHLSSPLFRFFLLDIALLIIHSKSVTNEKDELFLEHFASFLKIEEEQLLKAKISVQQFVISSTNLISFLSTDSTYEKMLNSLSKRWMKIISRNKDKLVTELLDSKDFLALVKKGTTTELSPEEKKKITILFKDIFLKSMPSLAVFLLPGGALLLPLLLKIVPDLLPTAFRDNEIQDKP